MGRRAHREIARIDLSASAKVSDLAFTSSGRGSSNSSVILPFPSGPGNVIGIAPCISQRWCRAPTKPSSISLRGLLSAAFYTTEPPRLDIQQGQDEICVVSCKTELKDCRCFPPTSFTSQCWQQTTLLIPVILDRRLTFHGTGSYPSYAIWLDFRSIDIGLWIAYGHCT